MSEFVHLHLHSQYSLLDGANKISEVVERAVHMGQPAIGLTDHGNMHGAIEFYNKAKKAGIKPVLGCELYINPVSRHERTPVNQGGARTHHLTVLAKNAIGYKNLCKLVSLAYKEGFYYKPRVDHELLQEYREGLIVLSGCLASEVSAFALANNENSFRERIQFYQSIFGENYFLEVQPHPIPEQQTVNEMCVHFAKTQGIPLVATTDCHYPSPDYHFAQEVLMCISTGRSIDDPDRIKHEGVSLALKSYDEMLAEFGAVGYAEEALANSVVIAQSVELDFDFSTYYMPEYELEAGKTLLESMGDLAREGLTERFAVLERIDDSFNESIRQVYIDRLEEEIALIGKMGFPGYFLVVADFINWAKEQDIPVGPGRGSCAGSLVAYCLRITEIDPISNKLLFERFLNPERISMPDIDVDFCINGRDAVIQYVVEKYGKDRVAQICTFGTLKAKAAIKDVGRVLGISYAETDKIAQLVPAPRQGFDYPLAEALKMEPRLQEYAEGEGQELISLAMKLEGLTRHTSTHAAGVVIGDRPLIELLPMMVDKDGNDVTQYSMKYVEEIGLVKFDFLGLKTLTVLYRARDIIKASQGVSINLNELPLDDTRTYDLLCSGNTTGVFQLESSGITEVTMRLRPSCFNDLVATIALYRPGPLDAGMVDHYIERKHGREPIQYIHPLMSDILHDTYGIMVYQEQIMQLALNLAGYSLGEADLLRRAMGKKVPEEMARQRDRFMQGTRQQGIDDKLATQIFDQMETFARYGFNRSHSAAYAMVSYQTAYLKAHYPVEFMAALMSFEMDDSDKTLKNFTECRKHKIAVLPPDVNSSEADFSVVNGQIRFGLSAIKGVGEKAVEAVLEARKKNGRFVDLEDFATRVDMRSVNKRVFENFIKSGAFDAVGLSRAELFNRIDDVVKAAQVLQREEASDQIGLFSSTSVARSIPRRTSNVPEWPVNQRLALERQAIGLYLSGHPLDKYVRALDRLGVTPTIHVREGGSKEQVRVGGVVTALRLRNTKKGDRYASFILEDSVGTIESIVWPNVYAQVGHLLVDDDPIVASGRTDVTEERCSFIIESIESLIAVRDRSATQGVLNFSETDSLEEHLPELQEVLISHRGTCPVRVRFHIEGEEVSILLRDGNEVPICVQPSEQLCDRIEQLFGRPVLSFV